MTHMKIIVTFVVFSSIFLSVIGKETEFVKSKSDKSLIEKEDFEESCFDVLNKDTDIDSKTCPEPTCLENEITWTNSSNNNKTFNQSTTSFLALLLMMILW